MAVKNEGHSDRVELRLRGPETNNDHRKIDVMVNDEYLEFDEHALAWHDMKGTAARISWIVFFILPEFKAKGDFKL